MAGNWRNQSSWLFAPQGPRLSQIPGGINTVTLQSAKLLVIHTSPPYFSLLLILKSLLTGLADGKRQAQEEEKR